MKSKSSFEVMLKSLDIGIFDFIETQMSDPDKKAILSLQRRKMETRESYCYLEIGSHLGGSIQPFLVDPHCMKIYSIDKRPPSQPDIRGKVFEYPGNSTARMLNNLRDFSEKDVQKITCFDSDAREVPADAISPKADICFIDGEYTVEAVASDFLFCMSVVRDGGCIIFHDAVLIHRALRQILDKLDHDGKKFLSFAFEDAVFCVDFGNEHSGSLEVLSGQKIQSGRGFLFQRKLEERLPRWFVKPLLRKFGFLITR